jgi:very-short-patch-repair endonuclease
VIKQTDAEARRLLILAVARAGGVARRARLVQSGHTQRTIGAAIAGGDLLSVRRRWIASGDADPLLLAAAHDGVTISCVTQARRLGLWVDHDATAVHVAAPPHSGRVSVPSDVRVHRARPIVPRHPDAFEDSIENTLALVCACQPFETALAIVESALNKRLADKHLLLELDIPASMRRIVEESTPFSDSGLETFVVPRLRWMGVRIVKQVWIAGHRVDFLIGERLVLQIDGGHHVGPQRTSDNVHDATLRLLGYHVIRVGYAQMMDDWAAVQESIMQAVARGLHLRHRDEGRAGDEGRTRTGQTLLRS